MPSKHLIRVRFPVSAPKEPSSARLERALGDREVTGSSPVVPTKRRKHDG